VELQSVLADELERDPSLPLNVGIGLDAGEAVPVEDGFRGTALNVAARLCSAAGPGEVLATEGIVRLAGSIDSVRIDVPESFTVKGFDEPVRASRLTGVSRMAGYASIRPVGPAGLPVELDPVTALVGRDQEARRLRWNWRLARRGMGRAIVIIGAPGSGKTRLAGEPAAIAAANGARTIRASALDAGGMRPAVEALLTDGPALIVADDLESATRDDLAALAEAAGRLADRPILLLALACDDAPADVSTMLRRIGSTEDGIRLAPLDAASVAAIVATYAIGSTEPVPVASIVQASGGVPAQVHALASDWAHREVTRRLGTAVSRAASGRRDLRRLEQEVASGVVDLQLARERVELIAPARPSDISPFKGLVAFDVRDADMFFGRERLVAEMVGRLAGSSFLAVVGPSGSGKSSAVRAGLIPALAAGAVPGMESWTRVVVRPGAHPMRELDRTWW
jgi:hypothetical protein